MPKLLRRWDTRKAHILKGCLSDPLAVEAKNCAPELLTSLLQVFNHRYNSGVIVKEGIQAAVGYCHDQLAKELNVRASQLGSPEPYPNIYWNQKDTGECFGIQSLTRSQLQEMLGDDFDIDHLYNEEDFSDSEASLSSQECQETEGNREDWAFEERLDP